MQTTAAIVMAVMDGATAMAMDGATVMDSATATAMDGRSPLVAFDVDFAASIVFLS